MQESYKARNTKRFISEYEKEFREGMMAMTGIKADYVETLIRAMKNGVTDLTKFNIAYFRGNKVTYWAKMIFPSLFMMRSKKNIISLVEMIWKRNFQIRIF